MRSGSLSRSRSRSPSQGLSDKANHGSDDDSDSVTIIIHKGLGGQHLATCKVDADASIGQLVARLKADPSIDGIDSHAIMNAEVAIGNLIFRLDDYNCKFTTDTDSNKSSTGLYTLQHKILKEAKNAE